MDFSVHEGYVTVNIHLVHEQNADGRTQRDNGFDETREEWESQNDP